MRLEQRIMIGTEIPRHTLTVDGGVEHAAQVDARDGSRVHADTHQTTGEVIHDHEHPIRPQHERFAAKQVDAPEAIGGVSDDRQPRRAGPVGGGPIVLGEHATHDVLVNVHAEGARDDVRDPWAAKPGIP